jgi:hypothetical protein
MRRSTKRALSLLAPAVATGALCEPYCAERCATLTGDAAGIRYECGACRGPHFRCKPGANGFPTDSTHHKSQKAWSRPDDDRCGDRGRANPCAGHEHEVVCFLGGLTAEEVMSLRSTFRNHKLVEATGSSWRSRLPPIASTLKDGSCSTSNPNLEGKGVEEEGTAGPQVQQTQLVMRRMLPRSATAALDAVASKLEGLAEHANEVGNWGVRVCRGSHCTGEEPQFMRYISGGLAPLHRDTFGTPSWSIGMSDEAGWDVEHPDGMLNFTQVSRRIVSVLVQLTPPSEYSGGALRLYGGTHAEPSLAQRAASSNGRMIVNAVRSNASVITAPACVGDVIVFVGLVPHDVAVIEGGARESFAWWVHGTLPDDGTYAGRTPWIDPRSGRPWEVSGPIVSGASRVDGDDYA